MWTRTWTRLWAKWLKGTHERKTTLGDILSNPNNRESFLGVQRLTPPNPETVKSDIESVIHYSRTSGYKVWSEEAWTQVIECVDKLMDDSLEPTQVDFYRGGLRQTLDLLRISFKAQNMKEEAVRSSRESETYKNGNQL